MVYLVEVLDYLGNKLGFDSQMNGYLQAFSPEERKGREKLGSLAEVGGTTLLGNKLLRLVPIVGDEVVRWNGRRGLLNQLKRGRDFKDVNFGKVSPAKLEELNKIRKELEQPQINSGKVTIPADRVEHIYERRVLGDRYKPEDATDTIYKALFGKNSKVYPDKNHNTLQHFVDLSGKPSNKAIVGKIRGENNIFVKTGFKTKE